MGGPEGVGAGVGCGVGEATPAFGSAGTVGFVGCCGVGAAFGFWCV
jgi:hypothetical protein